ncbi:MAG: MarR family transcriptional regulator [Thermodesulfobacteriota bacterium]
MNDGQKNIALVMGQFFRVVNKIRELEKRAYDFGVGELLFPSEIHTIQAIGNNSCINVSSLAREMGVTKAAASQMVSKLATRGFLQKVKSLENDKEVLLVLTARGKLAFEGHEKFHTALYEDFIKEMDGIPEAGLRMIHGILEKIEYHVDRYRE